MNNIFQSLANFVKGSSKYFSFHKLCSCGLCYIFLFVLDFGRERREQVRVVLFVLSQPFKHACYYAVQIHHRGERPEDL